MRRKENVPSYFRVLRHSTIIAITANLGFLQFAGVTNGIVLNVCQVKQTTRGIWSKFVEYDGEQGPLSGIQKSYLDFPTSQ